MYVCVSPVHTPLIPTSIHAPPLPYRRLRTPLRTGRSPVHMHRGIDLPGVCLLGESRSLCTFPSMSLTSLHTFQAAASRRCTPTPPPSPRSRPFSGGTQRACWMTVHMYARSSSQPRAALRCARTYRTGAPSVVRARAGPRLHAHPGSTAHPKYIPIPIRRSLSSATCARASHSSRWEVQLAYAATMTTRLVKKDLFSVRSACIEAAWLSHARVLRSGHALLSARLGHCCPSSGAR